jgi:hypothetical protein
MCLRFLRNFCCTVLIGVGNYNMRTFLAWGDFTPNTTRAAYDQYDLAAKFSFRGMRCNFASSSAQYSIRNASDRGSAI